MKLIGENLDALAERLNDGWNTTFRNEQGDPLLIFSRGELSTESIKEPQLLWRIHSSYYILTFSDNDESRIFEEDVGYGSRRNQLRVDASIRSRFYRNEIEIDS